MWTLLQAANFCAPAGKTGLGKDKGSYPELTLSTTWMFLWAGDIWALAERALGFVVGLGLEVEYRCAEHRAGGMGCAAPSLSATSLAPAVAPGTYTGLSPSSELLLKYSAGTAIEPKLKPMKNFPAIFNRKHGWPL